ncbi:MAG: family 78 glycoside hydrolase catalytic domain [Verrucomicrobiota bacterium]
MSEVPEEQILHIAADSCYVLWINGLEVGRGPARGTHGQNYYDSYDIAPLLKTGSNRIAVLVQCMNYDTFIAAPAQPAVMVDVVGIVASDSSWETQLAKDWRSDVETYCRQVGHCEWHDMRLEPVGWTVGEDSASWEAAWEIPESSELHAKALLPRAIPALRETALLPVDIPVVACVPPADDLDSIDLFERMNTEPYSTPSGNRLDGLAGLMSDQDACVRVEPATDGSGVTVIFDFGAELAGRFELELTAPEGCIVDVCHNESIAEDRLAVKHCHESYHFVDRYVLRAGRQTIGNSILERGFKMVQIVLRNFDAPVEIHRVQAVAVRYPFVDRASFNCDDLLLNRIWDACRETIESCTTDAFTDCPWRERAYWVNDMIVTNRTSLQMFGASEIHRRSFRLAFSEARDGGLLPGVCPCPVDEDGLVLVPTNLFTIPMMQDYVLYSGDKALARELMPGLVSILETFHGWEDDHGFILPPDRYWNFFDWSFELNDVSMTGKTTSLLSSLYVLAMKTMIELAEILGEEIPAADYRTRIGKTSGNLEKHFFKEDERRLADWLEEGSPSAHSSQLAHAFALLGGVCGEANRGHLEKALLDDSILKPELYLHYFIFRAMRLCGKNAEALERIRKYWGDIVKTGHPTIWESGIHEHGKAAFDGDGSLCHAFATSPIDFFQAVILGVEPLSPGFREFRLAPDGLDLGFAEGRIPTPHGNIFVRWEREGEHLNVELNVPEGTEGRTVDGRCFAAGTHRFKLNI